MTIQCGCFPNDCHVTLILTETEKLEAQYEGICFGLCLGIQKILKFIPKKL